VIVAEDPDAVTRREARVAAEDPVATVIPAEPVLIVEVRAETPGAEGPKDAAVKSGAGGIAGIPATNATKGPSLRQSLFWKVGHSA
jgi:hypothetical protein